MKVSDQIKSAGFKSAKELAQILVCSTRCLRDWEKQKPDRFRIMLAGAAEIKRQEQARARKLDPRGFYAELFVCVDADCRSTAYAVFPDQVLRAQKVAYLIDHPGGLNWRWFALDDSKIPASAKSQGFYNYSEFLS